MSLFATILLSLVAEVSNRFVDYQLNDREGPIFITDEARLHNDLFYMKRESHPTNNVIDVKFGLTLVSIVDFNAADETIVLNVYIRQNWLNPMISWKPEDYGGIRKINVQADKTWVPDIYAYGDVEAQFKFNGLLDKLKTHIRVSCDGHHTWLAPIIMQLGCGMNVKDFPFDTQTCPLLFGSFTHDKSRLNLIPEDVNMQTFSSSPQWILKSMNHTREEILYRGSTIHFSDVKYTVVITRKPLHFFTILLVPTLTLTFLSLLVFVQPITAGERCGYIITILLALSWFTTSSVDYLPSSSEGIPLSKLFVGISLLLLVLLSTCLCYTIAIYYGGLNTTEMPHILRRYVRDKISPYFGCYVKQDSPLWRRNLRVIREIESHIKTGQSGVGLDCVSKNFPEKDDATNTPLVTFEESPNSCLERVFGAEDIRKMNKCLDKMLDKLEINDSNEWAQREWHMLATSLDYICLYIFTSMLGMELIYCGLYVIYAP